MAIALVQHPYVSGAGTLTSWPIALTQATGSGNLLAVMLTYYPVSSAASIISGITDNATGGSNVYAFVPGTFGLTNSGFPAGVSEIWYCPNCRSGATTITVAFSSTITFEQGGLLEYSGAALGGALDVAGVVSIGGTGVTTFTGPTLTIHGSGDVITAVCNPVSTVTAVSAPFVSEGNVNNSSAMSQYLPGAIGSYTPTFTGTTGGFSISAAAFFPTAGSVASPNSVQQSRVGRF